MRWCFSPDTSTFSSVTSPCESPATAAQAGQSLCHCLKVFGLTSCLPNLQPQSWHCDIVRGDGVLVQVQHGDEAHLHILVAGDHLLHARSQGTNCHAACCTTTHV